MNLLRKFFGDRRHDGAPVVQERRGGFIKRSATASDRLERAVDELNKTVSMSRDELYKLIEGEHPKDKQ